jgi:hypothetical protein
VDVHAVVVETEVEEAMAVVEIEAVEAMAVAVIEAVEAMVETEMAVHVVDMPVVVIEMVDHVADMLAVATEDVAKAHVVAIAALVAHADVPKVAADVEISNLLYSYIKSPN